MHRIDRGTIVLTALSVIFALLVLLQMLPVSGGTDDAVSSYPIDAELTPAVFIAGALVAVLFIATLLVRATKRVDG